MLLGGKTFNNEFSWILNAIKRAYISAYFYSKSQIKYCKDYDHHIFT